VADTWEFAVGPWQQLPTTELASLTGRTVTWRLAGNHEAAFTLDCALPEAASIQELVSDLWVFRNGQPLYRGRVGAASDTADGSAHTATFSTADYRAVLKRRLLFDADLFSFTSDQSYVAWQYILQTQGRSGGGLGITQGVGQVTGVSQTTAFLAGTSVGDVVDQISQGPTGFDWDINPVAGSTGLTFDVYYPQRGTDRQRVVDFPGRIASFQRTVDPGQFANALRVTGGTPAGASTALAPVVVTEAGIATDPAGRFELQYGDTNIVTSATLTSVAQQRLALGQVVTPVWTVTLNADSWGGPGDIWLGDPVILQVDSPPRFSRLQGSLRVFEIHLALDDASDAATVSLTLGAIKADRRWQLRKFDSRLTALERR